METAISLLSNFIFSMYLLTFMIYYVVLFLSFLGENPEKMNIYDFCI